MLRHAGIERNGQHLLASVESDVTEVGGHRHRAAHPQYEQGQRRTVLNPSVNFESVRYRSGMPLPYRLSHLLASSSSLYDGQIQFTLMFAKAITFAHLPAALTISAPN